MRSLFSPSTLISSIPPKVHIYIDHLPLSLWSQRRRWSFSSCLPPVHPFWLPSAFPSSLASFLMVCSYVQAFPSLRGKTNLFSPLSYSNHLFLVPFLAEAQEKEVGRCSVPASFPPSQSLNPLQADLCPCAASSGRLMVVKEHSWGVVACLTSLGRLTLLTTTPWNTALIWLGLLLPLHTCFNPLWRLPFPLLPQALPSAIFSPSVAFFLVISSAHRFQMLTHLWPPNWFF